MTKRRFALAGVLVLMLAAAFVWQTQPDLEAVSPTEPADIATIVDGILTLQAREAAAERRPLARGTHAKGVCARAEFEVLDVMATVSDRALATRLARGLYATPAKYPATVRFANADSNINADSKPDVRAMSFAVEPGGASPRLDFSTNDKPTFPINDAHAFATLVKVVTAPTMAGGVWSLPFKDKLSFARTADPRRSARSTSRCSPIRNGATGAPSRSATARPTSSSTRPRRAPAMPAAT